MVISRRTALLGIAAASPVAATLGGAASAEAAGTEAGRASQGTGVLAAQRWLDRTFGTLAGWVPLVEDGRSGDATVAGLVQGTQALLGITPLVPSLGRTTVARLREHARIGGEDGEDAASWCLLTQAALIVKGFPDLALTGSWDGATEEATRRLRTALGAEPAGRELSANLFRALLTRDPILPVRDGDPILRKVQQHLNLAYGELPGGAYCGTGGELDLGTSCALVRAVQSACGDTAPDGEYGPTTARELRDATTVPLAQGATGRWVRLMKGLLIANGHRVTFSGSFGPADEVALRSFQGFQALPASQRTGTCDFGTWAALLASCGDADRPVTGADMATKLDAERARALRAAGITVVGRYLTDEQAPDALAKALTGEELSVLRGAGLRLWPIFEEGGYRATWFTRAQGVQDGRRAHDAARALGLPAGTTIYFAVDVDLTAEQDRTLVVPYFRGVQEGLVAGGSEHRIGVYGSRRTCAAVGRAGLAVSSYVAGMSTGWAGNRTEPLPSDWAFDQIQGRTIETAAGPLDIDANVVSGRDPGVAP